MRWSECCIIQLVLYGIIQYYTTQSAKIPILQTHICDSVCLYVQSNLKIHINDKHKLFNAIESIGSTTD